MTNDVMYDVKEEQQERKPEPCITHYNTDINAVRSMKKQSVRTVADNLAKAGIAITQKAFDILQTDNDGVVDISAILVEFKGDDFQIRYVYDD